MFLNYVYVSMFLFCHATPSTEKLKSVSRYHDDEHS